MAGIRIENLKKSFGQHVAVAGLDLDVTDGQFVVLLGPSGCGKTTTLNCIAGLEVPSSGRVLFEDVEVTNLPPHARNIAMVFQSALLYPHLTARANIEMSLRHSGMNKAKVKARVDSTVTMLRVDHLLSKRPSQLSGGERQRIALAKAIVREPSAFLMDEPFSALDAALRTSLRAELVHLQKKLGTTTIFVTHDQVEAMTMGDVIVVMDQGRVEQVGTPDEIYNNPRTKFVAGFIGLPPMNFFDGQIVSQDGGLVFETAGAKISVPDDLRAKAEAGGGARSIGVRPQHMQIVENGTAGGMAMEVYAVERLGKETVIILRTADGASHRVLIDPGFRTSVGAQVTVAPDISHAHFF
ncbi:MAG: ABC transporter ATP-binding protein [Alphaproteobacteria bacterium]